MVSKPGSRRSSADFGEPAPGAAERGPPRHSYTGLTWDKSTNAWRVRVNCKSKQHHVGRFRDEADAAQAYDCAALLLLGPSAAVNFGAARAEAVMPLFSGKINLPALRRLTEMMASGELADAKRAAGPRGRRPPARGRRASASAAGGAGAGGGGGGAKADSGGAASSGCDACSDADALPPGALQRAAGCSGNYEAAAAAWARRAALERGTAAALTPSPASCPLPSLGHFGLHHSFPGASGAGAASAYPRGRPADADEALAFLRTDDSYGDLLIAPGVTGGVTGGYADAPEYQEADGSCPLPAAALPTAAGASAPLAPAAPRWAVSAPLPGLAARWALGGGSGGGGGAPLMALLPDGGDDGEEEEEEGESEWLAGGALGLPPALLSSSRCPGGLAGGAFASAPLLTRGRGSFSDAQLDRQLDALLLQIEGSCGGGRGSANLGSLIKLSPCADPGNAGSFTGPSGGGGCGTPAGGGPLRQVSFSASHASDATALTAAGAAAGGGGGGGGAGCALGGGGGGGGAPHNVDEAALYMQWAAEPVGSSGF